MKHIIWGLILAVIAIVIIGWAFFTAGKRCAEIDNNNNWKNKK